MSVMSDKFIKMRNVSMIDPFVPNKISDGVVSYGLSSYGYDARVARSFRVFTNIHSTIIDPKNFSERNMISIETDVCTIPPNSFALAHTVEYFRIPRDYIAICIGKSTYARCGIVINVTPLEPEWCGHITIEISNTTQLPAKIYANEGICQCIFIKGDSTCAKSYLDSSGKYMNQRGVVLPRVSGMVLKDNIDI